MVRYYYRKEVLYIYKAVALAVGLCDNLLSRIEYSYTCKPV